MALLTELARAWRERGPPLPRALGELATPLCVVRYRTGPALVSRKYEGSLATLHAALEDAGERRQCETVLLAYATGCLEALAELHRLGFAHLDVAPDNFVLRYGWRPEAPRDCSASALAFVRVGLIDFSKAVPLTPSSTSTSLDIEQQRERQLRSVRDEYCWPRAKRAGAAAAGSRGDDALAWRCEDLDAYALGAVLYGLVCPGTTGTHCGTPLVVPAFDCDCDCDDDASLERLVRQRLPRSFRKKDLWAGMLSKLLAPDQDCDLAQLATDARTALEKRIAAERGAGLPQAALCCWHLHRHKELLWQRRSNYPESHDRGDDDGLVEFS